MRNTIRLTLGLAVALVVAAWSGAALADVFVTATIDKTKDINETIVIEIDKTINVTVTFDEDLVGDAEAHTVINQDNSNNVVDDNAGNEPGPLGDDLELDALLEGSVNSNSGIVGVNQDVGSMVNQVNAVSLAETVAESAVTEAQAHADQRNTNNTVDQNEELTWLQDGIVGDGEVVDGEEVDPTDLEFVSANPERLDPDKTAIITGSISSNLGVVGVNQNAGNNNNQANGLALAVGAGAHLALAEADLGQLNTANQVDAFETLHIDTITDSISSNSGIVQVNQTTGNNNNQGSMIAFSALTTTVDLSVPGTGQ